MGFLFAIFLAMTALAESLGCDLARLPPDDPPIDMSKFPGEWYESVTTFDPISMDHVCRIAKEIKVTPYGFESLITIHYDAVPATTFPIYIEQIKGGIFRQKTVVKANVVANESDEDGNIDAQAKSEYEVMEYKDYALFGDPDHYIVFASCEPAGWVVWVFTKGKAITAENLVKVHNDLLKRGITVPLRLSRCEEITEK